MADVFLPQPADTGGGFWGGLLDLLKNVPITIGDRKVGRTQLPSYNQMTAGRRLLDYGRAQGLDIPQTGSVSPDEAQFMVQQGLQRRQNAPLGMDVAQQFMVPQQGEGPDVMATRAMLARMPASGIPGLLGHMITAQGGLPGMGGPAPSLESMGITLPRRGEAAPSGAPAPTAPVAPSPTLAPPGPSGTAPATQPLATQPTQAPSVPATATMPSPPKPPGQVYMEDVENHPTVQAAKLAWARMPSNRKLQEAYYVAQAKAYQDLQTTQHRQYTEGSQEWRNQLAAQKEVRDAVRDQQLAAKALADAQRAPYGYGQDWDAQIRLDHQLPPGVMPTQEQADVSRQRLQANQLAQETLKTGATTEARTRAEFTAKQALPLRETLAGKEGRLVNTQTLDALPGTMLTKDAAARETAGQARMLTTAEAEEARVLRMAAGIVKEGSEYVKKYYAIAEQYQGQMTPQERTNPMAFIARAYDQLAQHHPELVEGQRFWAANRMVLARGIAGGKGVLNVREMDAANAVIPQLDYTFSLGGTAARFLGFSVPKPAFGAPDTKETALSTLDMTSKLINSHAGVLVGNPRFQFAGLAPRSEEERTQARAQLGPAKVGGETLTLREKLVPGPAGACRQGGGKVHQSATHAAATGRENGPQAARVDEAAVSPAGRGGFPDLHDDRPAANWPLSSQDVRRGAGCPHGEDR